MTNAVTIPIKIKTVITSIKVNPDLFVLLPGPELFPIIYCPFSIEVFREYPLFGSGVDTFKITAIHHFQPVVYRTLGGEVAPLRAHNEFLNMLATTGIVGTAAWLTMLAFADY